MKIMYVVSFEEFKEEDGQDLKIPIAVCESEETAWQYADVMPFECNVTEVIYIKDEPKNITVLESGGITYR